MATQHINRDCDTLKDRLILYGLLIGLSPIWIPLAVIRLAVFHGRLFRYLHGSPQNAWNRCARLWAASNIAYGGMVGPELVTPFEHSLAENFVGYHRHSRDFLIEQLHDPNPILAAFAFKCLIRCGPLRPDDIPAAVLARNDQINAQRIGCCVVSMTLAKYISDYFGEAQCLETTNAT
jgi:hypothetical protein